ncbi:MAG: DUF2336 domain-containing protein [Acetobacteraceae bacterium]|nr:DUF2336 domain-containing protein [Acetobacteraceae bacterium]MDW8397995.1 DUF2336 domain-containing protein [Acetobacteraceae bacterium]
MSTHATGAPTPAHARELIRIARHGDEAERMMVASSPATPPELLFFLGADRSAAVRSRVAGNRATPPQADRILARDEDPMVREVLARRIAALAPGLGADVSDRLRRMAWETLCLLAEDAVESVRAAVAETLADMPDAPRDLILRLARDLAPPVAEPVILLSPLLTDQDLLALIATPPAAFTRRAVARRPGLAEAVCDSLARTEDDAAIAALLGNGSARLSAATLDCLAVRAVKRLEHRRTCPARPMLSAAALGTLAGLVADEWARQLAVRADLPPAIAARLREALANAAVRQTLSLTGEAAGQGNDDDFLAPARRHDVAACVAVLAARSGLPRAVIERAGRLRSAKALISIAWKANLSPAVIGLVQSVVGGIPPERVLLSADGQDWPLTREEMQTQLDVLIGTA